MIVSRQPNDNKELYIDNNQIERVNKFKYLGTTLNDKWDNDKEIKVRIATARNTFIKFNTYLLRQEVPLGLRLSVVKCYTVIRSGNLVTKGQIPSKDRGLQNVDPEKTT